MATKQTTHGCRSSMYQHALMPKLFRRLPCHSDTKFSNPNAQWHFVYAGVGKSGKDEYLILNVKSGTY